MKTTKKKTGPKAHFARYTGGLASVRHSGRISRGNAFLFSGRAWIPIPLDPSWMCVKCNRSYKKGLDREGGEVTTYTNLRERTVNMMPDKNGKPTYCGNIVRQKAPIFDGVVQPVGPEVKTCPNTRFTDTRNRRFFKWKAEKNPVWEYKIE